VRSDKTLEIGSLDPPSPPLPLGAWTLDLEASRLVVFYCKCDAVVRADAAILNSSPGCPFQDFQGITMQDNVVQAQIQPFVKLAQANMELLARFWTSQEVQSQATANASVLFQQASESAMKLMQSSASAQLVQGMLQNYTDFLGETYQSWMAMISQGQTALLQQAEEVTGNVIDVTTARGRRGRGRFAGRSLD
jgi:hypothetical protein